MHAAAASGLAYGCGAGGQPARAHGRLPRHAAANPMVDALGCRLSLPCACSCGWLSVPAVARLHVPTASCPLQWWGGGLVSMAWGEEGFVAAWRTGYLVTWVLAPLLMVAGHAIQGTHGDGGCLTMLWLLSCSRRKRPTTKRGVASPSSAVK